MSFELSFSFFSGDFSEVLSIFIIKGSRKVKDTLTDTPEITGMGGPGLGPMCGIGPWGHRWQGMPDSIPWGPERALEGPKGPEVRVMVIFKWLLFGRI